jgi:hypothetical protein
VLLLITIGWNFLGLRLKFLDAGVCHSKMGIRMVILLVKRVVSGEEI